MTTRSAPRPAGKTEKVSRRGNNVNYSYDNMDRLYFSLFYILCVLRGDRGIYYCFWSRDPHSTTLPLGVIGGGDGGGGGGVTALVGGKSLYLYIYRGTVTAVGCQGKVVEWGSRDQKQYASPPILAPMQKTN